MKTLFAARERGAVLVVSLLILAMMTIIGVAAMDTSVMEEKMAGNMRDRNIAFQAAESALRLGETWIAARSVLPEISNDGSTGIWDLNKPDPDTTNNLYWWHERDQAWWNANITGTVILNCGQAIECGYDDPDVNAVNCLCTSNVIGARFGDNYDWTYRGFLKVIHSFSLSSN